MSSSRSARALVREAVLLIRLPTVPPSPWSTLTMFIESWLTSLGVSAWNSGWKPLNSSVRFSAGLVRETGMVPPSAVARHLVALLQGHVAVPDQVEEPDRGPRRRGQGYVVLDLEGDLGRVAVPDLDLLDRADGDSGDPDVVALLEQAGGGELGLVLGLGAEREGAHDRGQGAGDDQADEDEDPELDPGDDRLGVPAARAHRGLPPRRRVELGAVLEVDGGRRAAAWGAAGRSTGGRGPARRRQAGPAGRRAAAGWPPGSWSARPCPCGRSG